MSAQAPVGTTLAILERALKVMSAVQARIHYTMKQEFRLLAGIIRDNTPKDYSYQPEMGSKSAKQADYDQVDVIPVSDPNASTMSQRVVQYQAVMQLAKDAPQLYDLPTLHRQMIEVLGVKNAAKLVPTIDDMKPVDPVTENMDILRGKPVKAFLIQDHEAHLGVHMAAMHDPKLAAIMGQNPQAQAIQAAAAAHVMEHVAFQYRKEIEKMLGAALPPMKDENKDAEDAKVLPPEIEAQLAQLVAQAAAKLLQKNTAESQQQQAQQQQQDPLIQMQQQELKIKESDVQRKAAKDQADNAAKQAEIQLRSQEIQGRQQLDEQKLMMEANKHQDQSGHQSQQRTVDFQKHREQLAHQQQQAAMQTQQPKKEPNV
jgi:hypothetical protein